MQKFFYFFLLLFFFQIVYAQNNLFTKEEIDNQYKEVTNPENEKDIKKIETLIAASKKINYTEGIGMGNLSMLHFYYNVSDYKKMLEIIRETEALGIHNNEALSKLFIFKSYANGALGIQKEEFQNIKDALKYAKQIEDPDRMHYFSSTAYNRLSLYYDDYKIPDSLIYYLKKELDELEKMNDDNPQIRTGKYSSIALNNINIGNFYVGVHKPQRLDLAEPYFLKIYAYRTTQPDVFEKMDMPILCGVGNFYLFKKDYKKSIKLLNEVLQREKRKKNPTYRSYAYSALADAYEGLENPREQAKYTKLYAALNDSLNKVAKQEVNQQFERLVTKAEKKKEKEYSSNIKVVLIISGCFILILALSIWLYWKRKNKLVRKKYEKLIKKINLEKDKVHRETGIQRTESTENLDAKPGINIADETANTLLLKLEKFEDSDKYLRKDISLTWLANNLNTNTKYLSEIIKTHRDKTFNNYINGLRINYITHKLVEDPLYREYKINYLAEECGYSYPQVFVISFKKETGFTPSFFIENLKKDNIT